MPGQAFQNGQTLGQFLEQLYLEGITSVIYDKQNEMQGQDHRVTQEQFFHDMWPRLAQ